MALPNDYATQACSLARSLEVIGERWTLLIVRDAFYGVRRFGDFVTHLSIPRAVLTERLKALIGAGVFVRVPGDGRREEYELTDKGAALWPVVRALIGWGDAYYAPSGPRRIFHHVDDDGDLDADGRCTRCGIAVSAVDIVALPGPGLMTAPVLDDIVTRAMAQPHRLLQPLRDMAEMGAEPIT